MVRSCPVLSETVKPSSKMMVPFFIPTSDEGVPLAAHAQKRLVVLEFCILAILRDSVIFTVVLTCNSLST
jgi:hypothetical protein